MKFIKFGLIFFVILFNIGMEANDVRTIETTDAGNVLIYREPIGLKKKATVALFFSLGIMSCYAGYKTPNDRNDLALSWYGASAVLTGIGLYAMHGVIYSYNKMNDPLIILSPEGIWHEVHGFTDWRNIEGYGAGTVHQGRELIDEFVEFERCDGTHFQVYFTSSSIWDPVIGISKHKFIKLVNNFYNNK